MADIDIEVKQKDLAVQLAATVFHYRWIAKGVGISEDTLLNWRKEDKRFSEELEQARSRFIATHMRKARPDFLLETADRQTFGKQIKVEGTINYAREVLDAAGLLEGEDDGQTTQDT